MALRVFLRAAFAAVLIGLSSTVAADHHTFLALAASEDMHRFGGLHQEALHLGYGTFNGKARLRPGYVYAVVGRVARNGYVANRWSLGVGWRHHFDNAPEWFMDFSFSPTYLTRHHFPDSDSYQDLGTRYHFASRFALGWHIDEKYGVIMQLEHLSNGGLGNLNPGTNQFGLAVFAEL